MSQQPPWNPYGQQQGPGQYQGPPQPGWPQQPYQGQEPYPGQPYGPPGGQSPFPRQGPPPRRSGGGGHWVRNILSGIGAVVVAGIVINALSSHSSGVSTTASGNSGTASSSSSATAPAPAKVGSYFDLQDSSGNTYRVTLVKVIDPAQGADQFTTPDSGKRFVGAVFRIKAVNGSPQGEDANNDAVIVGSDGQSYTADFSDIAGYTNFANGVIHVAQGETVTGAVTFQVPDRVKVAEVQWGASSNFGSTVQWDVHR
jgi:hypothetical protein